MEIVKRLSIRPDSMSCPSNGSSFVARGRRRLSQAEWTVTLCPQMRHAPNRIPLMLNALLVGGTKKWLPTARFRAVLLASVFWT